MEYKRTQIQLTEAQHDTIRKQAFERDISMSEWIREAVDEKLRRGSRMAEVRGMTDAELQERVIGQTWDKGMLGLDWIDRYPVVDVESKIVDVVSASDGTPEGLEFDEHLECYVAE